MKIAFVDIVYGYTVDRPDSGEPLGGTTSAICFVARELIALGHTCVFFNRIREATEREGVWSYPLQALVEAAADQTYDAFVFCSRWDAHTVEILRGLNKASFVAWMQESQFNDKAIQPLAAFDKVAFISEWQKKVNQQFCPPHWKQGILRNAMNPKVATLFDEGESMAAAKSGTPRLLFVGNFDRGAFNIAPILDHLRSYTMNFSMEIYCETEIKADPVLRTQYMEWLRSQPNVTHLGKVGQTELAQRMKGGALLLAPNTWPETSCIALIESMAAGLTCVVTDRAVLPETASGFATLVELDNKDDPINFDMKVPHALFAKRVAERLQEWEATSLEEKEKRLLAQRSFFLKNYQYAQRAKEWLTFLQN